MHDAKNSFHDFHFLQGLRNQEGLEEVKQGLSPPVKQVSTPKSWSLVIVNHS